MNLDQGIRIMSIQHKSSQHEVHPSLNKCYDPCQYNMYCICSPLYSPCQYTMYCICSPLYGPCQYNMYCICSPLYGPCQYNMYCICSPLYGPVRLTKYVESTRNVLCNKYCLERFWSLAVFSNSSIVWNLNSFH